MAYPNNGFIKIYPDNTQILSGQFALNNDATPQPSRTAAQIDVYYAARVTNLAVAPCLTRNTEKPAASGVYVPLGGTYELQFDPSTVAMEFYDAYPGPVIATKNGLNANFPVGLTIQSPLLGITGQSYIGPSRDREIDTILGKYFGSTVLTFTPAVGVNTYNLFSAANAIITNPLESWSIFQVMRNFGFSVTCNVIVDAGIQTPRSVNSECFILAAYSTQSFVITNNTPNVMPGQIADLTITSANLGIFNDDEFRIYWDTLEDEEDANPNFPGLAGGILIPRNLILELSSTRFRFIMPYGPPFGGRRLMLTGTASGVLFTGEFPLQNFNIQLVDGSGLYTLVANQAYDTYYDRSVTPVTTIDLKIPDPFAKTGFLP